MTLIVDYSIIYLFLYGQHGQSLHYFNCRKFFALNFSKVKLFSKSLLLLAASHDLEKAGK